MNTNNTQPGHLPTESLFENNNDNDSNPDQLLSTYIVIVSQQQPMIQFNETNMIPSQIPSISNRIQLVASHITLNENLTRGQLGRRRRRQRQRQRRRQHRQEQNQQSERLLQQEHHRYQRERRQQQQQRQQRQRQQQNQRRQQQERPQQLIIQPRYRRWSSPDYERDHERWVEMGFSDFIEENISPALEEYYWERMTPNERQATWEQNHLNEIQKTIASEQQDPWDYLEAFAILEHLASIQDELEQMQQIHIAQQIQQSQQQHRHNAEQLKLQNWEQDQFERHAIDEYLKLIHLAKQDEKHTEPHPITNLAEQ